LTTKFFQGAPCKRCLQTVRYASGSWSGKCVRCCRARDRARYSKRRPQQKAYYEANREAICAGARAHGRAKHAKDPRYKMLSSARARAKIAARECTIALEDIIIPEFCPLLGVKIITGTRQVKTNSPTLDRKDSTKGYVPGNVWVISWRANRVKSDSTLEEMKLIVKNWP
jgi:hypothetical protein